MSYLVNIYICGFHFPANVKAMTHC